MKKLKISEIDKSDIIVSVVSQLISFFEQGYQFDCEYWRFQKDSFWMETNDHDNQTIIRKQRKWIIEMKKYLQRKKNQSENGLKRMIWRGCIQLKMNYYLIENVIKSI